MVIPYEHCCGCYKYFLQNNHKYIHIMVCCRKVRQRKIKYVFSDLCEIINANDSKSKQMQMELFKVVRLNE